MDKVQHEIQNEREMVSTRLMELNDDSKMKGHVKRQIDSLRTELQDEFREGLGDHKEQLRKIWTENLHIESFLGPRCTHESLVDYI